MGIRLGLLVCALIAGCAGSARSEQPPRTATVPIAAPAADGGDASGIDAGAEVAQTPPAPPTPDASVTPPNTSTPGAEAGSPDAAQKGGCMRTRKSYQYRCSGMAPRPGESNGYPVTVCDRCLTDSDCTAKPGGRCSHVGGPCMGAPHLECKYPSARCGGHICPEPAPQMPPSMPRR